MRGKITKKIAYMQIFGDFFRIFLIEYISRLKQQKQYIYVVYILYTYDFCKNGKVSYGYLMGMVWVSYGAG